MGAARDQGDSAMRDPPEAHPEPAGGHDDEV
jgi:hypothetical protein